MLWAAYGGDGHRNVPQMGSDYSLIIFPVNATGCYRYVPEENSLVVHDPTVNKQTIGHSMWGQGFVITASVVLVVVWNQSRMDNGYFASAEAGCFVQSTYLAANSINLGTCCVGGVDSDSLRNDLKLPSTLIPLLVMPVGFPASPYPRASPNYDLMTGNLPPVQYGTLSFGDALRNMIVTREWSPGALSLQELSQLLWAAYGYTNVTHKETYHRTTPSAFVYPLIIFVSNATGVYQYLPESHSVLQILSGDKRFDTASACSGQTWAANAPAVFLIVYNSSLGGDGGAVSHEYIEVDAGAVTQEIFLEASAWNLSANIVTSGFEQWNGTTAEELRNILGLPPSLIPLYIIPIGHEIGYNLNLRVKDWTLIDDIQGAYVYKDSEWKISDQNGWTNWTDVSGAVAIKVMWFGVWVNGTFTITIDGNKTVDVRCNIFDTFITCVEGEQHALLQYVNVTAIAEGNAVVSGITGADGETHLTNVPNSTLNFVAYDDNNNLIANDTRIIVSEGQQETIICDMNYEISEMLWEITEVLVQNLSAYLPLISITFVTYRIARFKYAHTVERAREDEPQLR